MHSGYKVISHGFGLPQLVGVTVVHHVETVETTTNKTNHKRSDKMSHRTTQVNNHNHVTLATNTFVAHMRDDKTNKHHPVFLNGGLIQMRKADTQNTD